MTLELNAAKYVVCLFVIWCAFVLPFPVLSLIRVARASQSFWYAEVVDALVTGLFISHPILLPVVAFVWRTNICGRAVRRLRACCGDAVVVADANSNAQSTSVPTPPHHLNSVYAASGE